VNAGAAAAEIVDVLIGVIPVVGLPRVVAAAPKLALALGYDLDEALECNGELMLVEAIAMDGCWSEAPVGPEGRGGGVIS
jgi:hypothetical protein